MLSRYMPIIFVFRVASEVLEKSTSSRSSLFPMLANFSHAHVLISHEIPEHEAHPPLWAMIENPPLGGVNEG